jgi:hypothetical protein
MLKMRGFALKTGNYIEQNVPYPLANRPSRVRNAMKNLEESDVYYGVNAIMR